MIYFRIKKNTDIQKIFNKGKRAFSSRLTVLYIPAERLGMAVCVSKKHGGAVVRNTVKRKLREIFRLHAPQLNQNYFYILLPKVAERYDYRELEKDFLYIVHKNNLEREQTE